MIALSINLGFPKGSATKPTATMEIKTINVIL